MHLQSFPDQGSAEQRLCRFSGPPETIKPMAEMLKERSPFVGEMMEKAKTLQPPTGETLDESRIAKVFASDEEWRKTWLQNDLFTQPRTPQLRIIDIRSFLLNLDPDKRKECLLQYLRERFPVRMNAIGVAGGPFSVSISFTDFNLVESAPLSKLGDPNEIGHKALERFMIVGKEMHGAFANPQEIAKFPGGQSELERSMKEELENLYADPTTRAVKPRAFQDYVEALNAHPEISRDTSIDWKKLRDSLAAAGEKTPFAAALRYERFDDTTLKSFREKYDREKGEQQKATQAAERERLHLRNQVDDRLMHSFVDKVVDNFKGLETWQKWLVVAAGGYLAYRTVKAVAKPDKSPFLKWVGIPALAIGGFYLTGARRIFDGTSIGSGLEYVEGWAKKVPPLVGVKSEREKMDFLNSDKLEKYARYFREMARRKVGPEIEAMGYLTNIPLGVLADDGTFTMDAQARGGHVNLTKDSPIVRNIHKQLDRTGQASQVVAKLRAYGDKLGPNMVDVFARLGGLEQPGEFTKLEDIRGTKSYDELPDGSPGREMFKRLANKGQEVAKTKYASLTWFEVIEKFEEGRK